MSGEPDCSWPFHREPGCEQCYEYDRLYEQALADFLQQQARRKSRRSKQTP